MDDKTQQATQAGFKVGELIRIPTRASNGYPSGFRVWVVMGIHLGGQGQENVYSLSPVDLLEPTSPSFVPCIILETNSVVERFGVVPVSGSEG